MPRLRKATPMRQQPAWASPEAVQREARNWTDDQLECRTYGHRWNPSRAVHYRRFRYFRVVQLCGRCTAERVMELSERGTVLASWYQYPDGYLSHGLGRIAGDARDALRLATITRVYDVSIATKADEEAPHSSVTRAALGMTG